jgi:hypothetical protein
MIAGLENIDFLRISETAAWGHLPVAIKFTKSGRSADARR